MAAKQKNLFQLFVPISLETLCFMLTGMVDTMMLSSVSDALLCLISSPPA